MLGTAAARTGPRARGDRRRQRPAAFSEADALVLRVIERCRADHQIVAAVIGREPFRSPLREAHALVGRPCPRGGDHRGSRVHADELVGVRQPAGQQVKQVTGARADIGARRGAGPGAAPGPRRGRRSRDACGRASRVVGGGALVKHPHIAFIRHVASLPPAVARRQEAKERRRDDQIWHTGRNQTPAA